MSGNAMEEGLILQIHNPSHNDPSRIGFLAGALLGFVFLIGLTFVAPNLPRLLQIYAGIAVGTAIGTYVTCTIIRRRTARAAQQMQARRDMLTRDTARRIAAMNRI